MAKRHAAAAPAVDTAAITAERPSTPFACPVKPCGRLFSDGPTDTDYLVHRATATDAAHIAANVAATTVGPDAPTLSDIPALRAALLDVHAATTERTDAAPVATDGPVRCRNHKPGQQPVLPNRDAYNAHRAAMHADAAQTPVVQPRAATAAASAVKEPTMTTSDMQAQIDAAVQAAVAATLAGMQQQPLPTAAQNAPGSNQVGSNQVARATSASSSDPATAALLAGIKAATLPWYAAQALAANGAPMTAAAITDAAVAAGMPTPNGRDQAGRSMATALLNTKRFTATNGAYGLATWPASVLASAPSIGAAADKKRSAPTTSAGSRRARSTDTGPGAGAILPNTPTESLVASVRADIVAARAALEKAEADATDADRTLAVCVENRRAADAAEQNATIRRDAAYAHLAAFQTAVDRVTAEHAAINAELGKRAAADDMSFQPDDMTFEPDAPAHIIRAAQCMRIGDKVGAQNALRAVPNGYTAENWAAALALVPMLAA